MEGCVYLLCCGEFAKIGCCKKEKLDGRIRAIDGMNPLPVELQKTIECNDYLEQERYWLNELKEYQVKGEWFKLPAFKLENLEWFELVEIEKASKSKLAWNARIEESQMKLLETYCQQEGRTKTDVVRELIRSLKRKISDPPAR